MAYVEKEYPVSPRFDKEFGRGKELCESGEPEKARAIFLKLLSEEPEHPRLLNGLANTYRYALEYEEAERIYLRIIEIAPDFSVAYANLCAVYSFQDDMDKALRYADLAIELRPKDPVTWHTMGLFYVGIEEYEIALEYFLAAYSIDKHYYTAAFNIACLYNVFGEPEKSLPYLEASLVDFHTLRNALNDLTLVDVRSLSEFDDIVREAVERLKKAGEEIPDALKLNDLPYYTILDWANDEHIGD